MNSTGLLVISSVTLLVVNVGYPSLTARTLTVTFPSLTFVTLGAVVVHFPSPTLY